MTLPATQQEIFWPAPVQGMVTESNYVQQPTQFARFLRNFIVSPGSIRVRGESKTIGSAIAAVSSETIIWSDLDDDEVLWSDGAIRTVAGSTVYNGTITSYAPFESTFLTQKFLSSDPNTSQATIQRNNGTWGTFNYTLSTLTAQGIGGAVGFKGKCYFWGTAASDGQEYLEYGGLRAITGATTSYGVSAFLKPSETILFCRTPTIEQGLTTGVVFVVYGSKGSVLVYDGADPASWTLTGRFDMTPPLTKLSFVDVQGDVVIIGRDYLYSTRAMFTQGSQAAEQTSLSRGISQLYASLARRVQAYIDTDETFQAFGHFLEQENALIISLGFAADAMASNESDYSYTGTGDDPTDYYRGLQIVYFRDTGAISLWDIPSWHWPVRYHADGPRWIAGRQRFYLDITASQYGVEAFWDTDAGAVDYDQVESAWTTPILTARAFQNAKTSGVRAFAWQDDGAHMSAVGVIGNGGDQVRGAGTIKYLREDSASIGSASSVPVKFTSAFDQVHEMYGDVGLQSFFQSATMRLNKLNSSASPGTDDRTSTRRTEVFGLTVYFEPGGTF